MYRSLFVFFMPILVLGAIAFASTVSFDRPSRNEYQLRRGRAFLEATNYLMALEIFKDLVDWYPEDAQARTFLGIVQLRLHLYQASIESFEDASELNSRKAGPSIGLAHARLALGEIAPSIESAKHATDLEPLAVEAWIVLAQALWRDRSYGEAETAALQALDLDPQSPHAIEALLHIYMDSNKPDKFESLIKDIPEGIQSLQNLVVSFFVRQGKFGRAWEHRSEFYRRGTELEILEYELAIKRGSRDPNLVPDLMRKMVATGHYQEALKLSLNYAGSAPIDLEIGKAHWMQGDLELAISRFEIASRRGIHKLSAEIALGIITGDINHWREAFRAEQVDKDYLVLSELEEFLSNAPELIKPFIWRYAGIYEPYFYNRAVEEGNLLTKSNADDLDILLTMGTAYDRLGRAEEAYRYIDRAHDFYPSAAEPLARLARLSILKGESAKAIELLERAVFLEPSNPGYMYDLGWIYDQMSEKEKAIRLYRQAIALSELSFEAMNNLALIYSERGQGRFARDLLERTISINPRSEAAHFNLARYYDNHKEPKKAFVAYGRVLHINPLNIPARMEQARIMLDLERFEESLELSNRVLELDAQYPSAYLLVALAYENLGHLDVALSAAEEGGRIKPNNPELEALVSRLQAVESER